MKRFKLILFFCIYTIPLLSQDRASLEDQRAKIINRIEFTSKILKKTEKQKFNTLDYLKTIKYQIKNRKKSIEILQKQINGISKDIKDKKIKHDSLIARKTRIKNNYSKTLSSYYYQGLTDNKILFLLSSSNWDDFVSRKSYLKTYTQYTKKRVSQINKQETEIKKLIEAIEAQKKEKEKLLAEETSNIQKLKEESKSKDLVIKELSKKQNKLLRQLKKQKQERKKLNKSIELVIFEELSNREYSFTSGSSSNITSFKSNKFKFTNPVSQGYIESKFGKHRHPTIKNVYVENNGIDIITNPNESVKVIYDGEVVGLRHISGYNWMAIVRHGDYYTVYSKMVKVNISKGDKLSQGQTIGSTDENGHFHFEIWHKKKKLNPEKWIKI